MTLKNDQKHIRYCKYCNDNYKHPENDMLISFHAYAREENSDTRFCKNACNVVEKFVTPPELNYLSILRCRLWDEAYLHAHRYIVLGKIDSVPASAKLDPNNYKNAKRCEKGLLTVSIIPIIWIMLLLLEPL